VQLDPAVLNNHFAAMGQSFGWRRAFACPCVSSGSGSAKVDCPQCDGIGSIWDDEVTTWADGVTPIRLGFTAQTAKKGMADFGVFEDGDAVLSIGSDQPCYQAGWRDRFRNLDATHTFSINLRRGFGDKMRFSVLSIERVFWLDATQAKVEASALPTLGADGALTWPGTSPPAGTFFSITGQRFDEYFVYLNQPMNRNIHGLAQPRKLPARRFDLLGRT
jgi:hypothetical protein